MNAPRTGPILFASDPSSGRINPLLVLARHLADRYDGEIWFASTDDRRPDIESIPRVKFASLGEMDPAKLPENFGDAAWAAFTARSRIDGVLAYFDQATDFDFVQKMYERSLAVVDEVQPAMIVVEQDMPYMMDAALARRIPFIMNVPIPITTVYADRMPGEFPKPMSGLPLRMSYFQRRENRQFEARMIKHIMTSPHTADFFRKRLEHQFPNPGTVMSIYADAAEAVFGASVFGFEVPLPEPAANLKMLGAIIPPLPEAPDDDSDLTRWLDRHESIVYAGFGTLKHHTRAEIEAIVEATRRLGPAHHLLWKLPRSQQHLLGPTESLPANLRIVDWVPSQHDVLAHPHVRVYFNHGGGNGVVEGVYFGKPQLIVPFWMDCYDWAARVAETGVGISLKPADLSARTVARKLTKLLTDRRFAARTAEWSTKFKAAGGTEEAGRIILAKVAEVGRRQTAEA